MQISPIGIVPNFKSATKQNKPQNKPRNLVGITGGIALGGLGATAITGFAHLRKSHLLASTVTMLAAAAHILSLRPKTSPQIPTNYKA